MLSTHLMETNILARAASLKENSLNIIFLSIILTDYIDKVLMDDNLIL